MALYGVGKSKVDILCQKRTGEVYSIVAIGEATITRTPNAPACLKLKVSRNDLGEFTPENGEIITLTLDDDHDMFWGYIIETNKEERIIDIVAYDQLWYFNQNSYTKNYGTLKASDLYVQMAQDFGFSIVYPPTVEDTQYSIVNVILEDAKPLDIMIDALNITYEHTGTRYYVYDAFHNLCLSRDDNQETLKVNTLCINHFNCKSYSYKEDIKDMYNVIQVVRKNDKDEITDTVRVTNEQAIHDYGQIVYTTTAQEGDDMQALGETLLDEKCKVNISLTCNDVIGDPRVFGGGSVFVDLFTNGLEDRRENIRGWFSVDSVTHKISNGTHYMDLDLSLVWMFDNWDYQGIDVSGA